MKKNSFVVILSLVISLICTVGLAQAAPYTVGSGWANFCWGGAVPTPWDTTFDFTLTNPAILKVADAGIDGDRFNVTDNGLSIGNTSIPYDDGADIGGDYDGAFADYRFSSGWWVLFPGSHSITGTTIAEATGYPSGCAGVRVDNAANCFGSLCYQSISGAGWHRSQCIVYVPGMGGTINVGQVIYSGCTPGSCPRSFCIVVTP